MRRTQRGFSLLELLIVVAIILIVATIAIPSLLRSRQAANESAAVASLRLLNVAQNAYITTYDAYGTVDQLVAVGLLDDRFNGTISGYDFEVSLSNGGQDYVAAAAAAHENTGRYDFYALPDSVIRYTTEASRAPAGLAGEPVQ